MTAVDVGSPGRPGRRGLLTGRPLTVPAALLVVLVGLVGWSAHHVQAGLQQQARAALDAAGLGAQVEVSGRDAVVLAASPDQAARVAAVVAGVPGIRTVDIAGTTGTPSGVTAAPATPSGSPPPPTPAGGGDEPRTGRTGPGTGPDPRQGTTVRFATDRAHLSRRAKRALDTVAAFLATHPRFRVRIQGFTDDTGTVEGNLELSRRRAAAVSTYLEHSGVARSRLVVEAYGATRPAGDNGTPRGRATNRRVELVLEKVS